VYAHTSNASDRVALDRAGELRLALFAMLLRCLVLSAVCALWGCTLETGRAGETCKRSSQCQPGLGCVRGKCSKDLGPIAKESTVPMLGAGSGATANEAGAMPAADGGMP
jgi:hypothetical protein